MVELEKLRSSEIFAMPKERAVVFIPIGVLEDHGDGLPIGLDLLEARALCTRTAGILEANGWNTLLTPNACFSIDSSTSKFALRVRPHVVRDYLVDTCDALARVGFRKFVAVSGTPGPKQLTAIEEAGLFLRKRHMRFGVFGGASAPVLVSGISALVEVTDKSRSPFFLFPKEHGGARDVSTALALGLDGELAKNFPAREPEVSSFEQWKKLRKNEVSGYWGKPSDGNAEAGRRTLDEKAKTLAVKLEAGFQSGKPHHLFKSWYSIIPMNRSLFRVWILVVLLAILLGGWTFLSVQTFLGGADYN